jgi:hypothetical protein
MARTKPLERDEPLNFARGVLDQIIAKRTIRKRPANKAKTRKPLRSDYEVVRCKEPIGTKAQGHSQKGGAHSLGLKGKQKSGL